jgi:hypothetical protein
MARRGTRDLDKERFWRRMLQLWRRAGRPAVRDFGGEHGLAEASFYSWRRLIAERDHERRSTRPARPERPLFVPLNVAPATPKAVSAPALLELVLSSGQVVRVPAGFDSATLRQLLAVLGETPTC